MTYAYEDFAYQTLRVALHRIFRDVGGYEEIADAIIDEVIEDIEETADEDFTDEDVRIAMARVLKKRLGFPE